MMIGLSKTAARSIMVLLIALSLGALACGSEESNPAGGSADSLEVVATDFQFESASIEVARGESAEVTLNNEGEAKHSFTVEELDLEVEAEGGQSATGTLEAPDEDVTYEFFCEYHPDQMRGKLIVGSGGGAPAGGGGSEYEGGTPYEGKTPYEGETPHDEGEPETEDDTQGGYQY